MLRSLWAQFDRPLNTVYSTRDSLERHCIEADLVIGGVLIPGAAAPKLITADIVKKMKPGSVIVDVAIDQGGCTEHSRPTTHDDPVFVVDDVIHYCVANMPGAVPRTSTFALNNATLPYAIQLADKGAKQALLVGVALAVTVVAITLTRNPASAKAAATWASAAVATLMVSHAQASRP